MTHQDFEGELWYAIRTLLEHGAAIELDYQAGKYKNYEERSARFDGAARERIDWLKEKIALAPATREGTKKEEKE